MSGETKKCSCGAACKPKQTRCARCQAKYMRERRAEKATEPPSLVIGIAGMESGEWAVLVRPNADAKKLGFVDKNLGPFAAFKDAEEKAKFLDEALEAYMTALDERNAT